MNRRTLLGAAVTGWLALGIVLALHAGAPPRPLPAAGGQKPPQAGDYSLRVENVSEGAEVFIQSGDIVKGGMQDRVIAFDLIPPPRSGKVPVIACCVDQARWRLRGAEAIAHFGSSTAQLPSKPLKLLAGSYGQLGGQAGQLGLGGGLTGRQAGGRGSMGAGQLGQHGQEHPPGDAGPREGACHHQFTENQSCPTRTS